MEATNITKQRRDEMIKFLEELKNTHTDDSSIRAFNEIENALTEKKFGLVFEEHIEEVDRKLQNEIPVFCEDEERKICKEKNLPYNFIIEGDNLQALYLLEKTHRGKVDCIYIDPPYNSGARDWKYNNDYVDGNDNYRHSKWLSMMKTRLQVAKHLLNPEESVLICTIDEKEFLRLGSLLEEIFPNDKIQMVSSVINSKGVARDEFFRVNEYLFIVRIGKCVPKPLPLPDEWLGNIKTSTTKKIRWGSLMRSGSGALRTDSPGCFYPVFVSKDLKRICGVGNVVPVGVDRNTVEVPEGQIAVFPIHEDGVEGRWQYSRDKFIEIQKKGYVRLSTQTRRDVTLRYISEGWQKKVESGIIKTLGKAEDGSLILDDDEYVQEYIPSNQWWISSHNATEFGTKLLQKIIGKRFSFPKSLYAVHDVLKFFVNDKPNATVIDFFSGSGTTLHAVNLLNSEDGGNRKCIMVTNNEISVEEESEFKKRGLKKGSEEWEAKGIAKYVTWPRTYCTINGIDINGKPLQGNYGIEQETYIEDEESTIISKSTGNPISTKLYRKVKVQLYPELEKIKMSDGFQANVKYFKCDWIPRKPEDYLLSNALMLHIKEMIELENAIEVDNIENVIIYNRDDYNKYINKDNFNEIKKLWVNQNIIFSSDEIKKMEIIGFKYIPKEYFGQELKEASE